MMKKNILFGVILVALGLSGCSERVEQQVAEGRLGNQGIVVNLPTFIPENSTRYVADPETGDIIGWSSGDLVGVYYQDGTAASSAAFHSDMNREDLDYFVNDGFLLNPNSTYYSLFPYIESATPENTVLDFDRPYMAAEFYTDGDGNGVADFQHLTSLVKIDLSVPVGFYNRLVIGCEGDALAKKGVYNMIENSLTFTETMDERELNYGDNALTVSHFKTSLYMAPQDLSGKKLTFSLFDFEGNEVRMTAEGKDMKPGYSYLITAEAQDRIVSPSTIARVQDFALKKLQNLEYHQWMLGYTSLTNWAFADMIGGDANKGSTTADQPDAEALQNWQFSAENSVLSTKWNSCYDANKYANALILAAEDKDGFDVALAEGKFLRAFFGFEALRVFGAAIPYPDEEDYWLFESPIVSNKQNGSLVYIWDKIVSDLQDAIACLPESSSELHISKWSAKALLAKVYLFWSSPYNGMNGAGANHWNEAQVLLNEIISSGKFGLLDNYASIFTPSADGSKEGVFDIMHTAANGKWEEAIIISLNAHIMPGFGGWGFYQPSYEFVNSFMVDDNGLPLSDYQSEQPLTMMISTYNWETKLGIYTDPRLDATVGRYGLPYLGYEMGLTPGQYIRDVASTSPYISKKFVPSKSDAATAMGPGASETDFHVIRYAEILLMAAECAIHSGNLTAARTYINQVRSRAAKSFLMADVSENMNDNYVMEDMTSGGKVVHQGAAANYRIGLYDSFANSADAWEALYREYRLEFGMEGHRWFDLVRWGTYVSELNGYRSFEENLVPKGRPSYQPEWICCPIPQTAIDAAKGKLFQVVNW